MSARPRAALVGDWARPDAQAIRAQVVAIMSRHVEVAWTVQSQPGELAPSIRPAVAVVIGGDGTLIREARRFSGVGCPLIGINVGRLGFLAEFDVDSLAEHAAVVLGPEPPVQESIMLRTVVRDRDGEVRFDEPAVNDTAVAAGRPFRMIELASFIDGVPGPPLAGDGLVVATPVGSTAYSASAGGPILYPTLDALVLTPLAAHSLAFRPTVLPGGVRLRLEVIRANEGTSLVQDGVHAAVLRPGDRIEIHRDERRVRLVLSPDTTYWAILRNKLRWAAPPLYREPHEPAPSARPGDA